MQSENLASQVRVKSVDTSWDYREEDTKYSNHGFHTYPAMMIPQIARRLIETYGKKATTILDPFMGTGTVLLEAILHPDFQKAYGVDINPLAILISKVKTTPIDPEVLWDHYRKLIRKCLEEKAEVSFRQKKIETPKFYNIDFWFKPDPIMDLAIIKKNIDEIETGDKRLEKDVRDFFLVSFSETVRNASNTRKNEYKLYRMSASALRNFQPNGLGQFQKKSEENIQRMSEFMKQKHNCPVSILQEDTRLRTSVPDDEIDLIITSPPYGDSRTTVAYGQFSRLSLQWLGFEKDLVTSIDAKSLGGIPTKNLASDLNSRSLDKTLRGIAESDPRRARDVLSFYVDFDKCIEELHRVTRTGAFLCFVVGNRRVKSVQIPTDEIITELFQTRDSYVHHHTYVRNIPNKRMPKQNSPTNVRGNHSETINQENIVILERI